MMLLQSYFNHIVHVLAVSCGTSCLPSSHFNDICTAWNEAVCGIFHLPFTTHRFSLPYMIQSDHIRNYVTKGSTALFQDMTLSENEFIEFLSVNAHFCNSPFGLNRKFFTIYKKHWVKRREASVVYLVEQIIAYVKRIVQILIQATGLAQILYRGHTSRKKTRATQNFNMAAISKKAAIGYPEILLLPLTWQQMVANDNYDNECPKHSKCSNNVINTAQMFRSIQYGCQSPRWPPSPTM